MLFSVIITTIIMMMKMITIVICLEYYGLLCAWPCSRVVAAEARSELEREDGCKSVSLKQLKLRGWERACGEVEFAVWQGNN